MPGTRSTSLSVSARRASATDHAPSGGKALDWKGIGAAYTKTRIRTRNVFPGLLLIGTIRLCREASDPRILNVKLLSGVRAKRMIGLLCILMIVSLIVALGFCRVAAEADRHATAHLAYLKERHSRKPAGTC